MKNQPTSLPKVAVITRTKDRALLLERAIKSVHKQTMRDFIHVIINDAGDDKVVDDLVERYKDLISGRVKVIHNTQSHGMEAASNKAIKSVNSVYVAIHDDDDTWHPDFLEKTVAHMEATQSKGVIVTADKINEEVVDDEIRQLSVSRWLPGVRVVNLYKQCLDNYATPITFIYSREVYDNIGYYDETLPVAGDWDFALRFLMEYDIEFLVTEYALANYHHRPTALGKDKNSVFVDKGLLHEQKINYLANKHMREELRSGKLGLGYIINSLRFDSDTKKHIEDKIDATNNTFATRIEGHVNMRSEEILNTVRENGIKGFLRNIFRSKS
ncbi:MAG: glycosyltransferase family 2 protein [Candidatus Saccharimonadales bacterium]